MKKLFVSALAILGLVACAKDDVVSVQDNRTAIGFDTYVENVTRVGYTTDNLDGFDVWAYMGDTRILTNEDVTKSNGAYNYTNTQYWIPGQPYFFAALAPLNSNLVDDANVSKEGLGEITFTNGDGTTDLIYSTYSVTADGSQDKVNFQFNHLLSKVKFSFVNAFDNANYTFTVSNIKMTAPEKASIDLTANGYTWYNHADEITLTFADTVEANVGDTVSPADDLLTIPAGNTQEYNVTFDVNLYVAGALARTYNKEAKISGIAFEAGKGYSLTATINAETFNLENIDFDATVNDWDETSAPAYEPYKVEVDGVNYDDLAVACGKAMELDAPVNFFQHVVVDADTTITVPAGEELTLNLNGYTLTGVTDQTGANRDMFTVYGTMTVNGAPITRASAAANGTISVKHIGTDMGWGNCTDIFRVSFNGVLNLNDVTAKNIGGTAMAYVVDMSNATDLSVNINDSTLESTYIPVRLFNNAGKHTVTIENTSLTGKKCCVWVQYGVADGRDQATLDETVFLNVYNPDHNNTFTYTGSGPVMYGFDVEVYFDAYSNKIIADGVGYDETTETYTVSTAEGLDWIAEQVDGGETFEDYTIMLTEDIDCFKGYMEDGDPVSTSPIGKRDYTNGSDPIAFKGTFDGQGHSIKNLYQNGWALGYHSGGQYGSIGLFSRVENATIKNLVIDGCEMFVEGGNVAAIAGNAEGDCTFENITIKNTTVCSYNNGVAGIVGWSETGNYTFKNIVLEDTFTVASFWGVHGTYLGGVVAEAYADCSYKFENIVINCRLDAYNDVVSNYQWYIYRCDGMLVGNVETRQTIGDKVYADPAGCNITCTNVTVNYGDWINYHYCESPEFGTPSYADEGEWKFNRVEPGYSYDGIDHTNCNHGENETHYEYIPFDQLFGGGQNGDGRNPVHGLSEYPGVTVNYPASYRREVSTAAALTEALGKGASVVLSSDIDLGSNILTLDKGQTLDLGGKTLTQSGSNRGVILKNGASLKNGVINHSGIVAAVRAWNIESIENVTINLETPASGTVTGIAVQQYSTVGTIKDVTVQGAGVTQAIEVPYQATVNLIENVTVDNSAATNGVALVINGGKVGKAKDCIFKGNVYGVTMHLKGVFAVGLELENCDVEGTTASIYAWDEKGISNTSGSLVLTYDAATTLTGPFVWDFEDECQSVVTLNQPN